MEVGEEAKSVTLACSSCGKRLKAPGSVLGRTVKCPACGKPVVVKAEDVSRESPATAESGEDEGSGRFRFKLLVTACVAAAVVLLAVVWLITRPRTATQAGSLPKRVVETLTLLDQAGERGLDRERFLALIEQLGGKQQAIARASELLDAPLSPDKAKMERFPEEVRKFCLVKGTAAELLGYCGREAIPELCRALKHKDVFACAGALDGVSGLEHELERASPKDFAGLDALTPILTELAEKGAYPGIVELAKEVLRSHNARMKQHVK